MAGAREKIYRSLCENAFNFKYARVNMIISYWYVIILPILYSSTIGGAIKENVLQTTNTKHKRLRTKQQQKMVADSLTVWLLFHTFNLPWYITKKAHTQTKGHIETSSNSIIREKMRSFSLCLSDSTQTLKNKNKKANDFQTSSRKRGKNRGQKESSPGGANKQNKRASPP